MSAKQTDTLVKVIASVFFLGYVPVASGTVGTLVGLLLVLAARNALWVYAALTVVLFAVGIWASAEAEVIFKERDSHFIIIDEVVGFLITMFGIHNRGWLILMIGFVLNRVFDILKPFPLRRWEDLPRGWGVMMDDVGAGIYSNLTLRILLAVFS